MEQQFVTGDTAVAKDLRLNLKKLIAESSLQPAEALLTVVATATSVGDKDLAAMAAAELKTHDFSDAEIQEAAESAGIMGMLNTYYRFRHMLADARNGEVEDSFKRAGLRMNALAKPVLGKERFEMLAFAVSVINGCSDCIASHEATLRKHGLSADQTHDLARIAAVVKGVQNLRTAQ